MTNAKRDLQKARIRRTARVRARINGTLERPRLAVYRSSTHISAQLIDDTKSVTMASVSDRDLKNAKGMKPVERAFEAGKLLAERAKAAKISAAVFDRRDKRYHGRVKALADGAREGGLAF